jgi:5-methylcytosine-specific restriction endonuclease McrA
MNKYTGLHTYEKTRRREKEGLGNYAYVRYADDFVVLTNGTKEQAEQIKEELYTFLKDTLRLDLSKEKTKITHLNDGFKFLGFRIKRSQGHDGMKTKVLIPQEALDKVREKITSATSPTTHQDSVNSKILALNRIIGGWCRYYQYTGKAVTLFSKVEHETYWKMGHWLGRKFQITMPEVIRRYQRRIEGHNTFITPQYRLLKATEFKTQQYKKRFLKTNPYTTQAVVQREEIPQDTHWTGHEPRTGMTDLRPLILKRDGYTCQLCDKPIKAHTAQIDHMKPVRRFKRPVDANHPDNLWTLCIECHKEKTKNDRQMESRVQ